MHNPAIVLLGIYPKESKPDGHTETCMLTVIKQLSMEPPKLGSIQGVLQEVECRNKLWYI